MGQVLLVSAQAASRSLFGSYGPSPIVYLINAVVAGALTWLFYYRFELSVDSAGQKVVAFLCWAAIWFTISVISALSFF